MIKVLGHMLANSIINIYTYVAFTKFPHHQSFPLCGICIVVLRVHNKRRELRVMQIFVITLFQIFVFVMINLRYFKYND